MPISSLALDQNYVIEHGHTAPRSAQINFTHVPPGSAHSVSLSVWSRGGCGHEWCHRRVLYVQLAVSTDL